MPVTENATASQEKRLASLVGRVEMLESKISGGTPDVCLDAHVTCPNSNESNARKGSTRGHKKTAAVRECGKLSENMSGVEKVGSHVSRSESRDLKEKLAILERRVEQEMLLKEEAVQKTLALTATIEAAEIEHTRVEGCLQRKVSALESENSKQDDKWQGHSAKEEMSRQRIQCLESQLEVERERIAARDAEIPANTASAEAELEQLKRNQRNAKKELASCAKDNDALRGRLLSLASEASMKDQTLSTALSQLKSLSENYYHVDQVLQRVKMKRHEEVAALEWSLDDMAYQMLKLKTTVHKLQTENGDLRDEIKRLKFEKQQSMAFRRGARGG